tara:strand:+ start:9660 stop:10097 length:438 start_codon:yes stop_codon:yes gene_type:complete
MKWIYENIDKKCILKDFYKERIEGTEVRKIEDSNHPTYKQYGLFATKTWEIFDVIGEYTGEIIDDLKTGEYLVGFPNINFSTCIDAEKCGNECRFINHYKNIKEKPNCKYISTYINCKPVILIVVIDKMLIDDEILVDYCYDFNS